MKRLVFLILAVAIGYVIYTLNQRPSAAQPFAPYDLTALASQPLPKQAFLDGVHFYAEGLCQDRKFLALINTTTEACLQQVRKQHESCLAAVAAAAPAEIRHADQLGEYSQQYVACVTLK